MMKIVRIRAERLHAGDTIVIKEGSIRKFYHVCEVGVTKDAVHFVYQSLGRYVHNDVERDAIIRVRR